MEQVIFGGYYNLLHDTNTEYNSLVGGSTWRGTESERYKIVSTDGVIKWLRVVLSAAPGGATKYTFTLMLNGAPTALTFDIVGAATSGSNVINEIDVTGGDYISLQCVPTDTPTAVYATWTSVFEGENRKESLILGGSSDEPKNLLNEYNQVMCADSDYSGVEDTFRQVVSTAGTIKNFYVKLTVDPGTAPDAYTFILRKGGVSQPLTVTIVADDTTGSDLVNTVGVVAGDVLTLMTDPTDSPSPVVAAWGMTFVASVDGESIVLGGSFSDLTAATEYQYLTGRSANTWNVAEAQRYQLGQVCTLSKLYILLEEAPGAGDTYTFTIRIAGADSNVFVTIADAATTGNSGALNDTVALDEYVNLKSVPTGAPTTPDVYWGFVCYIEPPPVEEGGLRMTLSLRGHMGYDMKTREGKARRRMW